MTTVTQQTPTRIADDSRAEYVKGLRALADILENHPEVPLPYQGRRDGARISFHFLHGDDPSTAMAATRRALGIPVEKNTPTDSYGEKYYQLSGQIHGLYVDLTAFRNAVCERVVTATRQVEVTEPDPDAVAALPKVTRTVTEEIVDWVCHPVLAAGSGADLPQQDGGSL